MKQQILVVDDEPQIRELLALYLAKHGYQVGTASNSEEALGHLRQHTVDLVVLDIGLGGEDGLNLLTRIKESDAAPRVVMLTGMGFVEDVIQEALSKGADGYVNKALPLMELLVAIERAGQVDRAAGDSAA